jgi:3-oxoacyl-[acyl-carrier protein] reductase
MRWLHARNGLMDSIPGTFGDLHGKVAVVTGASHGVGAGIARELARQGVNVVVNGRDTTAIASVVDAITARGQHAVGIVADLTDESQVRTLRTEAEQAFGTVDIVVACVGGQGNPIPIGDLTFEAWNAAIAVNLTSAFLTLREFIPPMVERATGAIVTMASTAGRVAAPASPAYAAGKAGLIMLSRHTALQVAPNGVRINTIALGPVFEGKPIPPKVIDQVAQLHPLRRTGTLADVASTVAFLVSDASAWMTGATIDLSGGHVML